jgi:hypothetical protein
VLVRVGKVMNFPQKYQRMSGGLAIRAMTFVVRITWRSEDLCAACIAAYL